MDRGAWQATVHGVAKELDMTEQLNNNNIELVTILLLFNTGVFFLSWRHVGSQSQNRDRTHAHRVTVNRT